MITFDQREVIESEMTIKYLGNDEKAVRPSRARGQKSEPCEQGHASTIFAPRMVNTRRTANDKDMSVAARI
jgi:hypothetical protein